MRLASTICLCLAAAFVPAFADTFGLNSSAGVWSSATPAYAVTGVGTNQIRWGDPPAGGSKSGYDYNGATPPTVSLLTETQFLVGTFVHHNQPVYGYWLTAATLSITMDMTFDGSNIVKTFAYQFDHVETSNGLPCQFPAAPNDPPCGDRVRILNSIPASTFSIGSTTYTLDLLGFSQNGGTTVSNIFYTQEEASNTAQLFGKVTSNFTPVPEPASIVLLLLYAGLGSTGLCLCSLRRRRG